MLEVKKIVDRVRLRYPRPRFTEESERAMPSPVSKKR
jgi:hypothetical protein